MTEVERLVSRYRSLLLAALILLTSMAAGYGIYAGQRKILLVVAAFTVVVLLRRSAFVDFYLVTLACMALGNTRIGFIRDEFERYKWEALFVLAIVALVVMAASVRALPWPVWEHLLVGLFVGLGIWSVSWSRDPWYSFQKVGVFGLIVLIAFGGAWCWARDLPRVRAIAHAHLDWLWMVFPVSLAYFVLLRGNAMIAGRLAGPFENPNNLGMWSSTGLPLLFAVTLTTASKWRKRTGAVLLAAGLACAVLSGSRGGLGGAILGIGGYLLVRWPRRTLQAGVVLSVVLFFWMAYDVGLLGLEERVQRVLRPETLEDLSDRTIMWELAMMIARERPWIGHGFGLGERLLPMYGFEVIPGRFAPTVHNTYLDVWMNNGYLGLALLVVLLVAVGVRGLLTWWRDREGELGLLALGLTCALVGSSAHGVVESIFTNPGSVWTLPYWVTMALVLKLHQIQGQARAPAAAAPA